MVISVVSNAKVSLGSVPGIWPKQKQKKIRKTIISSLSPKSPPIQESSGTIMTESNGQWPTGK